MPKWVQALIDITILISELIAGGWLLYGLLRVCARHTATSRFWQSFFVTTFVAATFAFCLGEQWHLSVGSAVVVATVAACLAMYVLCSVTLKQAAGIAILFVVLMGGMQAGVTILMDRVMPNRWTFAQQYALAEAEANRMSVSTKSFFNFRDTLAVAMDALAKFTNRKDAEILNTDVAVGLAVLRERRAAATNREEVVANQEAFAELSQELLGTPGQTGAVTVTVADIRAALERMPRTQSSSEPPPDLDMAVSNLMANLSSTNGVASLMILGHTLADVSRELKAMKSNEILSSVATDMVNTQMLGFAGGLTAAVGEGALAGESLSSITSQVAIASGAALVYVDAPEEMKISGVVSRRDGSGYVVCNGSIIPVGGDVSVISGESHMRLKLEAIEGNSPRWTVVENPDAAVISIGGH